jgi:hypothetical protein
MIMKTWLLLASDGLGYITSCWQDDGKEDEA